MGLWLSIFVILSCSISSHAQEVQNAISIIEKATITVENIGRSPTACLDCDVDDDEDLSFYSEDPTPPNYDSSFSKFDAAWAPYYMNDGSGRRPTGFDLNMVGPNVLAPRSLDPANKIERQWKFVTKNGSKRETYIRITDDAGSGYLSQLMETVIVLIPRNNRPHIEAVGDELHVTLTTGEKVIYDKATRLIKSGVLKEGAIDLNPNRHQRKFVPLTYSGTGIMIRSDKRGEEPRLSPTNATISQNGKTCQVPTKDLWLSSTDFKFSNDKDFYKYLETKCPGKFKL